MPADDSMLPDALRQPDWATCLFRQALQQKLPQTKRLPTLQDLLDETGPLPPYSVLIGGCDDGRHLFLDLRDPRAGSLLIVGERGAGKTRLLRTMMTSLSLANDLRQARLALISADKASLQAAMALPHCFKAATPYADEAAHLVESLAQLTQQRRQGRQRGPAVVLLIDELDSLVSRLDRESRDLLRWLTQNGPQMRVWLAATLPAQATTQVEGALLRVFGAWLLAAGRFSRLDALLPAGYPLPPDDLTEHAHFYACLQGEWLKFWIPDPA